MGDATSTSHEWIELRNTTGTVIDLSNWELTRFDDNTDTEVLMLVIPSGQISSGGFFLISNNAADDCQLAVDPDLVTTTVSLANTKLQIKLYDGDFQTSTLIDTADDMVGVPAAGDNPVGGLNRKSMVRNDIPGDGTLAANWHTADKSFGWDPGATELGTPGDDNALPVQLSLFTAAITDRGVILRWRTESETNNLGFWIYRSSQREGGFVRISPSIIRGAGTSGTPRDYTYMDVDAEEGQDYYYYIEDIAFNGTTARSPIVRSGGPSTPDGKYIVLWGELKRD